MKPSKLALQTQLIEKIRQKQSTGARVRLLELGCGRAEVSAQILKACPDVEYVGIEPDADACVKAGQNVTAYPKATIVHGLAYGQTKHEALHGTFDFVFSLSVLEHVKRLDVFLQYATRMTSVGGENIHLYDLGHSLTPSGTKEWLQTRLCNSAFLRFMPESKVARYLATEDVKRLFESTGCRVSDISFHNTPSHVALLKAMKKQGASEHPMIEEIIASEKTWSEEVKDLKTRERLFPSICFWTIREK